MIDYKKIALGLTGILIYFLMKDLLLLPFIIFNIDVNNIPDIIKTIYLMFFDLLTLVSLVYLFKDELKEAYIDAKENHVNYFNTYIKYWYLAIGLMMIANLAILTFTNQTASNQDAVIEIFKSNPIYIFYSAVLIAPIVEELVFRLSFRYLFKKDWLFILLSGLSFGLIHIISAENILNELIFIIPYSIPGFIFAYALVKSKNILVPIGLHFLHNGILISLQFLTLFLS